MNGIVAWVYPVTAVAVPIVCLVLRVTNRVPVRTTSLFLAINDFVDAEWARHSGVMSTCWAFRGVAVVALIIWWISGGGDDTRRGLRKLREKFTPTRRTAPVTS